jgi:chromosome segregation ATPase
MVSKRKLVMCLVVAIVGSLLAATAFSQEQGDRRGRRRFDPAQMRQRMMERLRERLGASEKEWTVLGPRVEKVMELSARTRGGGMRFLFRSRRGRSRDADEESRNLSPLQQAAQDLREAVETDQPDATEIKERLTALRQAREQVKADLEKAQEKLREVVTLKQEAQLVLMGMLD